MKGAVAATLVIGLSTPVSAAPFMVVGNDEKAMWDDEGKLTLSPAGRDTVVVLDLAEPENPRTVATLQLQNFVIGPPVNVAVAPDGALALVANSVEVVKDGDALKQVPDNKVYVVDLKANPPALTDTIAVGKQPSGIDISAAGDRAAVANRADGTVTLLSIKDGKVAVLDTASIGLPADQVAHVAFTPDGKRAVAVKFASHKLAVIDVAGDKLVYGKLDIPTGLWPYNVSVAPSGTIAITADNGAAGASDGSVDTVTVVDLEATPPRAVDRVVVGDGPEGFAISPRGDLAVAAILRGGNASKKAYFYSPTGSLSVLKVDGKTLTRIKDIPVGGLPEPVAFTPDGRYLYVGNYFDRDISILKVEGTDVVDTGKRVKMPGHPASARIGGR